MDLIFNFSSNAKKVFFICCIIPLGLYAETVEQFLSDFHNDPNRAMDKLPAEIDQDGSIRPRGYIDYNAVRKTFKERKAVREKLTSASRRSFGLRNFEFRVLTAESLEKPNDNDLPEKFVEPGALIKDVRDMETAKLTKVRLSKTPYTDSYWPIYKGIGAVRYADQGFPNSKIWLNNYNYIQSKPASVVVNSGDSKQIDALSPAEKYDLAVGDTNFSLTNFAWGKGKESYERVGGVPSWVGYCHGWSAAAHMEQEYPEKPVTVMSPSGIPVTFYPTDARALMAMLWANANVPARFAGNRCNTPQPARNAVGRIIDPNCYDVSSSTWHISLINQMGVHQRSFSMDTTVDAQVWNFPLAGYEYSYFNPQSLEPSFDMQRALIPIERFTIDKFREFRDPNTKFVLGVVMNLSHVNVVSPTRRNKVEPPLKTLRFVYDLELDGDLNIIGGEWYLNSHPDFLWTFDKTAQAYARGETAILQSPWLEGSSIPASWTPVAQQASSVGEPLYSFIRTLVERSRTAPSSPTELP